MTDNSISKTGLDFINRSPLDYWWRFINPDREPYTEDKKTAFEKAFRMSVTKPTDFNLLYARQPVINRTTSYGKAEYATFISLVESKGQIPLTAVEYDMIISMRDAVLENPLTKMLFYRATGTADESVRFTDINSEATVKFSSHWVHVHKGKKLIVNLASISDASSEGFSKEAFNSKLHKRAAIQMDGLKASGMVFVMVEKEAPFKLQVHTLDSRSIDLGRAEYVRNCITYMECLRTDNWPGFPEKINETSLPEWAFKNY